MPIDRAQTLRNAEKLLRQGKLEQAIAEYLRAVEQQPGDWNTANVLGDLYIRAGQTDNALEQFRRIADSLTRDGFLQKASALYKKILKIRPDDEHALLQSGDIAARQGLLADARAYLNAVRERQRGRGDVAGMAAITIRLASLDPHDHMARMAGARARVELGDIPGAMSDLKALAAELEDKNRTEEALAPLREAARIDPADLEVKDALSRLLSSRGDPASAGEAYTLVAHVADDCIARADWSGAAAAFQGFLTRVPHHIPTLLRLVEICVDGGLDAVGAQAQLADAYLEAGSVAEARFIAEDLVARDPSEPTHVERLRRVLSMLGESDPDHVIAALLEGVEEFPADDASQQAGPGESVGTREPVALHESGGPGEPVQFHEPVALRPPVEPNEPERTREPVGPQEAVGAREPDRRHESVEAREPVEPHEIERAREAAALVERIPIAMPGRPPIQRQAEVNLTVALDGVGPAPQLPLPPGKDIEGVFAQMRDEASRRLSIEGAEQDFERGMALYRAGEPEQAMSALESAARAPRFRFDAAVAIARIFRERGHVREAIEWLERAAEAPARTPGDGHRLLLQLADQLESVGEVARALAICLELRAEAGDYQDVAVRVDRLAKVQARG